MLQCLYQPLHVFHISGGSRLGMSGSSQIPLFQDQLKDDCKTFLAPPVLTMHKSPPYNAKAVSSSFHLTRNLKLSKYWFGRKFKLLKNGWREIQIVTINYCMKLKKPSLLSDTRLCDKFLLAMLSAHVHGCSNVWSQQSKTKR